MAPTDADYGKQQAKANVTAADADRPHSVLGRSATKKSRGSYRIERLLGRGGMGAVFLAYDTTLHRPAAIKILEGHDRATSGARLLRESV